MFVWNQMPVLGFRFGDIAYLTDMSSIPESVFGKLRGLKHLTLNTVSYHPHHSHFSLSEAVALANSGIVTKHIIPRPTAETEKMMPISALDKD